MEVARTAALQVLVMFLLMGVGFLCQKKKIITVQGGLEINKLVLYFATPAIILRAFSRPFDPEIFEQLSYGILLALIAHTLFLLLGYLLIRGKEYSNTMERFSILFSNSAFMGIPLISALIGQEGILFASAYVVVFTLFQWTAGLLMLTGKTDWKTMVRKLLWNPGTLSFLMGVMLFVFPIVLPSPVVSAMDFIASLNTPLAMILAGTIVAKVEFKRELFSVRIFFLSFIRLILAPLLMLGVYRLFGDLPQNLIFANFIAAACPAGVLISTFPTLFGRDGTYGSVLVAVTTLLSILTLPLMVLVFSVLA